MLAGLLTVLALAAPPDTEPVAPAIVDPQKDAHKDALAQFGAAVWNLRRDRLLTAVRQLEEVAKKDPTSTASLKELIRVYTLIGREPEAIKLAKKILRNDPNDFDVAHTLARLLFDVGDLKEAIAAAKLAAECPIPLTRAEKAVGVYRDLATLCEKVNEPATAETALLKAIELIVDKRKEVIASGAFTPVEADTAAAECLVRLGKVYTRLKKFNEAAAAYTSAAKLYTKLNDPTAAASLDWNLTNVLHAKGDYSAALIHLNRVLKNKPISTEPYFRLAQLLRALDRGEDAIPKLQDYLNLDRENLALQTVYAAELARAGDPSNSRKADSLFAKINTETNDPKLLDIIVHSQVERGNARMIVADLDRAFEKLKDSDKEDKPVDTAKNVAAKAFAADKARTIADILNEDPHAANAVLEAAANDLRAGVTHIHQTFYFLGRLAARHHKWVTAASEYKQVLRSAPKEAKEVRADAFIALIAVLRVARKPSELADACLDGLRQPEIFPQVYCNFYLSHALAELKRPVEAIDAADKAVQFAGHGDRLMVRLHKVGVLSILEKWDEAIALAKQLLDEFPSTADQLQTRYTLATTYWAAGKQKEGEAELRAILAIDPDHASACNDLGFHLADQGRDLDEAEQLVRNAIVVDRFDRKKTGAADPENAAYIDSLGWVLFRKGKLPEARAELERAVKLYEGETDPIVWDHLGDVLFRLGEKTKAKEDWKKAEELYKNDPRGSSHRRDDRYEELKRKIKLVP
jgi:tetratricopeptide (TPR) repeat protein